MDAIRITVNTGTYVNLRRWDYASLTVNDDGSGTYRAAPGHLGRWGGNPPRKLDAIAVARMISTDTEPIEVIGISLGDAQVWTGRRVIAGWRTAWALAQTSTR